MKKLNLEKQDIIIGSSKVFKSNNFDRINYVCENMQYNSAYVNYLYKKKTTDIDKKILNNFIKRFKEYRINWKHQPIENYKKISNGIFDFNNPLCVDIETASICDLACPHCFREHILTPDKIMDFNLYKKIIDEIVLLNVPSIKLNWRGEPLLNPKICDFIRYAKENGILEVAINTNATNLTESMSENLINSGLDLIIYSFDGGTKETYEKMRPGRFKKNKFDQVINNIKNFDKLKTKLKKNFPITKIQMVMTEETRNEIENFYDLFHDFVDEITVTPYSERGGNLNDISASQKKKIEDYFLKNNLPSDTPYMIDSENQIFISNSRLPCDQIFQRLMITYDGRVAMCCMDWGAQHCIGYIDNRAIDYEKTIKDLKDKIEKNKFGFELLKKAKLPSKYNEPKFQIKKIIEIWNGDEINKVRVNHAKKNINKINICKKCDFKDTYEWKKI